jgi:dephospho-CoA kinase
MLLALTGGAATGKSTFRRLLAERHRFEVFDADACVHELLASDQKIVAAVAHEFGEGALDASGAADRAALRRIVFADRQARQRLEAIVHPAVRTRWQQLLSSCHARECDFLADIPLLYETSAEGCFDAVTVVAASPAAQRGRLVARGLDSGTIEAMLASQLPIGEKVSRATSVVWNDGTLGALARQADLLLERLFSPQS